jgi:nucleoside-diphosphate-sugar epimerase
VDRREVEEVFHLAAVYDLGVEDAVAERVNVEGTRRVLEWTADCPALARFHYVSTCYVSGRHPGRFLETQLEHGNLFNNAYERTKYLAEVLVWRRLTAGLPGTIYRPSIVVGDSRTGATQKFDGPYHAIQWVLRQPRVAVMPVVGDPGATYLNVVPRDFVVDAIEALSRDPDAVSRTYQLADPDPLTVAGMLEVLAHVLDKRIIRVPLARELARWALGRVPGVQALLRIPPPVVDYFTHPTLYDVRVARDALDHHGIAVPRFAEYAPRLVDFMRRNAQVGSVGMA